jgi:hypothetical protein
MVKWRQEYTALAKLVKTETPSYQVLDWFRNYKTFVPHSPNGCLLFFR